MEETILAPLAMAAMMGGVDASVQITLSLPGNVQREIVQYECEGRDEHLFVDYVNAAPNYLAIVPVEGQGSMVFANVVSASGARYAAGQYVWWTSGADASLYDEFAGDDPVLSCFEVTEAP